MHGMYVGRLIFNGLMLIAISSYCGLNNSRQTLVDELYGEKAAKIGRASNLVWDCGSCLA